MIIKGNRNDLRLTRNIATNHQYNTKFTNGMGEAKCHCSDQTGPAYLRFAAGLGRIDEMEKWIDPAGGLKPENALEADSQGCWSLDVNSGIEQSPGVKDPERMRRFFEILRG